MARRYTMLFEGKFHGIVYTPQGESYLTEACANRYQAYLEGKKGTILEFSKRRNEDNLAEQFSN